MPTFTRHRNPLKVISLRFLRESSNARRSVTRESRGGSRPAISPQYLVVRKNRARASERPRKRPRRNPPIACRLRSGGSLGSARDSTDERHRRAERVCCTRRYTSTIYRSRLDARMILRRHENRSGGEKEKTRLFYSDRMLENCLVIVISAMNVNRIRKLENDPSAWVCG